MDQPLRSADLRPRGAVREDVVAPAPDTVNGDRLAGDDIEALVAERVAAAAVIAGEIDRGLIEPRPASCLGEGGCRYPAICRCLQG